MDSASKNSKYAMGNQYELKSSETKSAEKIMIKTGFFRNTNEDEKDKAVNDKQYSDDITYDIEEVDVDFIKRFLRPVHIHFQEGLRLDFRSGGPVERLRTSFDFDMGNFPLKADYMAEMSKILYLIEIIEHTPIIPELQGKKREHENSKKNEIYFNLTKFLSSPSMENTGASLSGEVRYNGGITDLIKDEFEKEMDSKQESKELDNIKKSFANILETWRNLLHLARNAVDMGQPFDFDRMNRSFESFILPPFFTYEEIKENYAFHFEFNGYKITNDNINYFECGDNRTEENCLYCSANKNNKSILKYYTSQNREKETENFITGNPYQASPIATFYFKILQFEHLGEVLDRKMINSINIKSNYDVPSEFVERMISYKVPVDDDDIKCYIRKNFKSIANDVFLTLDSTRPEQQRIRDQAGKVPILLKCCTDAGRIIKPGDPVSKLLVISCLQAIWDEKCNEEYSFYDYEYHLLNNHKPNLNLKNDFPRFAAQSLYWARQVEEHWYANLGKYQQRCQLRTFENNIYAALAQIFGHRIRCQNILEMQRRSEEYYSKIQQALAPAEES